MARKMPRWNVPSVLLGRLAVARIAQGRHIGSFLLFDALKRTCANELAWALFLMDAHNERAAAFYEKFGFRRLQDTPRSLWLVRNQAKRLIRA
jgi:predicted N-acetyltransferase YhbS